MAVFTVRLITSGVGLELIIACLTPKERISYAAFLFGGPLEVMLKGDTEALSV